MTKNTIEKKVPQINFLIWFEMLDAKQNNKIINQQRKKSLRDDFLQKFPRTFIIRLYFHL